mgnify:CR=1 FL=1
MQRAAFKVALSAIAVAAAFASTAHAAGFMLTEQSAGSLGRAYAGAGVDGTDLSGVYYNPATMVLHKGTAVQLGLVGVGLNLDYAGENDVDANGRNKAEVIPHGYFVHQINDTVWFGLGVTVPFGMGTEYDEHWEQADRGISANIMTVDINPNFAFKLSEKFSVGFGASIQYAQADLKKRTYTLKDKLGGNALEKAVTNESEIDADSIAWGWNVGFMWSPVENFRVGVSYRSQIRHDAEGDLTLSDPRMSTGNGWGDSLDPNYSPDGMPIGGMVYENMGTHEGYATVTAPAWAMASVAWDVNDLVSLYGTFRWTDWSSFDKLEITSDAGLGETITNKWRDTYLGSLGMDLRLTDWWTLRGGIAYESSPIAKPEYRTAIIPDADRWWFAIGSSFKWSDNFQTDVSFAHLHGVHERSLYDSEAGGKRTGKFRKLDAYLLGVQMVYKF